MWQVVGQDKILTSLKQSLREGNLAHAYLLLGPHHIGKRTLALNLAQAVNCDEPEPPCGQCLSCRKIAEAKHADVVITCLDSNAEISIDAIRELQHLANLPPYEGRYKVFIIDDAEYLSPEAANCLLKVLEEPPSKLLWLLLASEESRLLPTIVSRCQRLEFKPMPLREIQRIVIDHYGIDPDKANLLARLSHGCLGWAISAIEDSNLLYQRAQSIDKLAFLVTADLEQSFAYAQELAAQFNRQWRATIKIIEIWVGWWHDLMLINSGCEEYITNVDYKAILEKQASNLTLGEIDGFIAKLCLAKEQISKNINPRLLLEWLMLNIPRRKN
jgi:DNA polymerase-3 subunit delta'